MNSLRYKRIDPKSLTQQDDQSVFQAVAEHVIFLVGHVLEHTAVNTIQGVPKSVVNAWRLWLFSSEVAGNGLPDYFLNHCYSVPEARAYYEALVEVGAKELVEMFESAALLAIAEGCELSEAKDVKWFKSFKNSARWPTLESIEEPSMSFAGSPLSALVAEHLRASSSVV